MAVNFPSSLPQPTIDFYESYVRPAIRSEMELGYVKTRPRWTRTRRRFTLRWTSLTSFEKTVLVDFLEGIGYGGGSFMWTNPLGESHDESEYVLADGVDEIMFKYVAPDRWAVELEIIEI